MSYFMGTSSSFVINASYYGTSGNPNYVIFQTPPSNSNSWTIQPEKKMATYVVEQEDAQGKKARMSITIGVSINGNPATLTEAEQEKLASTAASFLGYKFLGKA